MLSLRKLYAPVAKAFDSYNAYLRVHYPKLYDLQTIIVFGTKATLLESKDYVLLTGHYLRGKPLTYKDVTLRWQYPRDVLKLLPVFGIMVLPFSTVLLIPLVYFFPAMFTRNFWSDKERRTFSGRQIQRRLSVVPAVIRDIKDNIQKVPAMQDRDRLRYAVNQAENGVLSTTADIQALEPIFAQYPFALGYLSLDDRLNLAWMNYVFPWRLDNYAAQLAVMDKLLVERLNRNDLSERELHQAAVIRCASPDSDLSDLKAFLRTWTKASTSISGNSTPLRLHFPLFLSYPYSINAGKT